MCNGDKIVQTFSSNGLYQLTNEQRKALAVSLAFEARPGEILLHTRYAVLEPDGNLALTAAAAQDWLLLHQQGFHVDEVTGEIIERRNIQIDQTFVFDGSVPSLHNALGSEFGPSIPLDQSKDWGLFESLKPLPFTSEQEKRIHELFEDFMLDFFKRLQDDIKRSNR